MTTIYSARWVIPVTSRPIDNGAVAIEGDIIAGVGTRKDLTLRFPTANVQDFGQSAIIPGLINAHTHLELTAMRGYLENEESDFFAWLRKLTVARLERMTSDDIQVSATWGACIASLRAVSTASVPLFAKCVRVGDGTGTIASNFSASCGMWR